MRKRLLLAAEVTGVGVAAVGVAFWSIPAALVAVGAVVVVACEVRG